ncbi:hypothetical protein L596_019993 [Steinernema carpocapsae]|uniref:Uncharacterized protein n=1 Tax=Steinernema carpocapsae TaxID=34508 RepID=A0A4U5MSF3_STECR|nr:hypothetical protein L596_019993 [Steinernema carpocapsae]
MCMWLLTNIGFPLSKASKYPIPDPSVDTTPIQTKPPLFLSSGPAFVSPRLTSDSRHPLFDTQNGTLPGYNYALCAPLQCHNYNCAITRNKATQTNLHEPRVLVFRLRQQRGSINHDGGIVDAETIGATHFLGSQFGYIDAGFAKDVVELLLLLSSEDQIWLILAFNLAITVVDARRYSDHNGVRKTHRTVHVNGRSTRKQSRRELFSVTNAVTDRALALFVAFAPVRAPSCLLLPSLLPAAAGSL